MASARLSMLTCLDDHLFERGCVGVIHHCRGGHVDFAYTDLESTIGCQTRYDQAEYRTENPSVFDVNIESGVCENLYPLGIGGLVYTASQRSRFDTFAAWAYDLGRHIKFAALASNHPGVIRVNGQVFGPIRCQT
jgi:hypothetical protein